MAHSRTPPARVSDWPRLARLVDPEQSAQGRARACGVFQCHFQAELVASSRLIGLLSDLREMGDTAPADIEAVATIVRDKGTHLSLLDRALRSLGDAPQIRRVGAEDGLSGWPPRARIARTMVQTLCVDGSLREAELRASARRARDPLALEVLGQLAADMHRHTRLGWSWLGREARRFPSGLRDWVADWLPEALAEAELRTRPSLDELTRVDRLDPGPFGELAATEREVIFLRTMHERILPQLRHAGFDSTSAWSLRPAA
jgi:hypothetical protein